MRVSVINKLNNQLTYVVEWPFPTLAGIDVHYPSASWTTQAATSTDTPVVPASLVILTDKAYRDLFTQAEQDTLLAAAGSNDVGARRILLQLQTASTGVDLSSPAVAGGLTYMVSKGWLTEVRKQQVLNYKP